MTDAEQYLQVQVVNSSGFDDSQVYVLGFGLAPGATNQSFIQFDPGTGNGTLVAATVGESASAYSLALNSLPAAKGGGYTLNIPPTVSGRIHLSINQGLCLTVNTGSTGAITINDPNAFNPLDPNYFTLWDKFEFDFQPTSTTPIWINTTAVDFFGLPLSLSLGAQGPVGLTQSRSTVLSTLTNSLTGAWENLVLSSGSGSDATVLRVICPYEANGIPSQQGFSETYLDASLQAIWTYYQSNSLGIDVGGTLYTGTVDSSNNFNFTSGSTTVTVPLPASNDVFSCNGGTLTANPNDPAQAAIVTVLGAALNLGLLPLAPVAAPAIPTLTNAQWTASQMPAYYTANPQLAAVQWNVYSAALHNNQANNQGNLVYAFPYDDQAGQSSLLASNDASSVATITIGDCSGTTPPTLTGGSAWTVVFEVGGNASGSVTNNAGVQYTLAGSSNVTVPNLTSGFTLTYNTTGTNVNYTVYIVDSPPQGTFVSACPADLAIVVVSTSGNTVTVQLPGGPAPS